MFSLVEFSDAGDSFVKIKKASLTYTDNKAKVTLEASLAFQLSDSVQEALHSGIVLYWDVFVSLKQVKWLGLWDVILFSQSNRYSLTYYTLLNNYRLKDEQAQAFRRFSSLSQALTYMRHIIYTDLPMVGYRAGQCVAGTLKVTFDKEMLPAPLRPIAYFDEQWDLSTHERQWCD